MSMPKDTGSIYIYIYIFNFRIVSSCSCLAPSPYSLYGSWAYYAVHVILFSFWSHTVLRQVTESAASAFATPTATSLTKKLLPGLRGAAHVHWRVKAHCLLPDACRGDTFVLEPTYHCGALSRPHWRAY